jgi:hypothetical protein
MQDYHAEQAVIAVVGPGQKDCQENSQNCPADPSQHQWILIKAIQVEGQVLE